jgi:hypothetical protein
MRELFETLTGTSLLTLLALDTDVRMQDVKTTAGSEAELISILSNHKLPDNADANAHLKKLDADWRAAENAVLQELKKNGALRKDIDRIEGLMIATDFHRLTSAGGSLAAKDIMARAHFYSVAGAIADSYASRSILDAKPESDAFIPIGMNFKIKFRLFLDILHKLSGGFPNDHFFIDFKNRRIR